jgi:hypothetical protein
LQIDVEIDDDDESITDTDYVFILNNEGKIKGVLMPSEDAFEVPKSVKKICKLLGLDDPNSMGIHSIH